MGHPALVVRAPVPHEGETAPGVDVRDVADLSGIAEFERVMVEGYPMPEAAGLPPGTMYPPGSLEGGVRLRLGVLDNEVVAAAAGFLHSGIVNLCAAATLPPARRRGVWEALVWARIADAPDRPAIAYTSDFSRPGFLRMGFLPIIRAWLWLLPPS